MVDRGWSNAIGASLPWVMAAAIGLGVALVLFGAPVLLGSAAFWESPRGIVRGSGADMMTSVAGYYAFARDEWRWPLFMTAGLGPDGYTNIIFTDSIPLLALLGRVLHRLTGTVVPLQGAWLAGCFVLAAMAPVALVRRMGARGLPAAAAAAFFGACAPVLVARWGHLALMAQGLIPLALRAYLPIAAGTLRGPATAALLWLLCAVALLITPYLFFMVVAIAGAALGQQAVRGRTGAALLQSGAIAAGLAALIAAAGHSGQGGAGDWGFGYFSLNLISPLRPQLSGVLPWYGAMLDATGGQYEGFAYLGAGTLLLLALAYPALRQTAGPLVRRHPVLAIVSVGLLAVALSNEVYAGPVHLLSIPLPDWVVAFAGVFRSSGRFVWVLVWVAMAVVVVTVARQRWGAAALAVACALQWVDGTPLRAMVEQSARQNWATINGQVWRTALLDVGTVVLLPPFQCMSDTGDAMRLAAAELHLQAARAGISSNSVYTARSRPDCSARPLPDRALVVLTEPEVPPPPGMDCAAGTVMTVCSATLPRLTLAALAATRPLPQSFDGP